MGITIRDIARLSGVGISTVSRVINNSGYVSEDVRRNVNAIIKQYHYVPNTNARNLKLSGSKNIALFVKGITNPFFNKMMRVIEQKAALRGYPLLVQDVMFDGDELEVAIRETQERSLCGVILMGGASSYTLESFRRLGVPCVLTTVSAADEVPTDAYSSVRIDDEKEGRRVTEYLISLGHRRIGFIYKSEAGTSTPNWQRYMGYCRALEEHDIPLDPALVAGDYGMGDASGYAAGFNAMKQLYARNHDMTAVFAFADILAIGAAKAAFSMGLRIPEDISIVGFDGIEAAEYYNPSLDTIYQPANDMALSSIETLFDMMQGGQAQHLVYDAVLMKRGSARAL